jgi:hypothetical protein
VGDVKKNDSLPPDWKQHLEQSIQSHYSSHPREKELMLLWLSRKKVEEAARLIWIASGKRRWNIDDSPDFFEHFEEVLLRLAISAGLRHLTVKDIRTMAKALEMIRDHTLFFREGPPREELERAIPTFHHWEEITSKTKPRDPGPRWAMQSLLQYFRDNLQKPLHQAIGLLIGAAFGGKWNANTVRVRATEWAGWEDAPGLKKATAANTTKEAWAALDKLEGEEYEAALEKMSRKLRNLYLRSSLVCINRG